MVVEEQSTWATCQGIEGLHTEEEINYLESVLNKFRPKRILEFGTYQGLLTLGFGNWADWADSLVLSVDISDFTTLKTKIKLATLPVIRFFGSEFSESDMAQVLEFLNTEDKVFVYCDGGYKNQEFEKFSKFLKSGDLIGVHDFERLPEEDEKYPDINPVMERVFRKDIYPIVELNKLIKITKDDEINKDMHVFVCRKE